MTREGLRWFYLHDPHQNSFSRIPGDSWKVTDLLITPLGLSTCPACMLIISACVYPKRQMIINGCMQDLKSQRTLIYLYVLLYIFVIGAAFHFSIWTVNNNKTIEIRTESTGYTVICLPKQTAIIQCLIRIFVSVDHLASLMPRLQ